MYCQTLQANRLLTSENCPSTAAVSPATSNGREYAYIYVHGTWTEDTDTWQMHLWRSCIQVPMRCIGIPVILIMNESHSESMELRVLVTYRSSICSFISK